MDGADVMAEHVHLGDVDVGSDAAPPLSAVWP